MDTQQIRAIIGNQLAENAALKGYVGKLENVSPEDEELAWKLANRVQKLGVILESCETMLDMKRAVEARYKDIAARLQKCKNTSFSLKRFEKACGLIREAIGVSIQNDDLSCLYSQCLRIGYSILKDRPKEVQSGEENDFSQEEQSKVVASVRPLFKDLIGFGESYGLWDDDIGEAVAPGYSKLRNAYLDQEKCLEYLFKTNSVGQHTYSSSLFEELLLEAEMSSYVLYDPSKTDTVLGLERVADVFDAELEHALWIIRLPVIREFKQADPRRVRVEITKAIQAVRVVARPDIYRAKWIDMLGKEQQLQAVATCSKSQAKRNDALDKLDAVQMNKREFLSALNGLRLTLRDIDCEDVHAAAKQMPDNVQKTSGKSRLRWKSKFAGKVVRGVITVGECDSEGYTDTFYVNEHTFKLTAGKAGALLDLMIEKQERAAKNAEDRQIKFSKKDRNLFKGLKCISNKKNDLNWFFENIIHLITDDHQKIVKAEFYPNLFG